MDRTHLRSKRVCSVCGRNIPKRESYWMAQHLRVKRYEKKYICEDCIRPNTAKKEKQTK